MKYDWIFFDADETLFHFDAFNGMQLMFSRKGVDFTKQDFVTYQATNQPLWVDYQDGKITADQLKYTRFNSWAQQLNTTPEELNSAFLEAMADICSLLPGAKELVQAITVKAKVGIITNGFTDLQAIRLARTEMDSYIDQVIISEEVGTAKPDSIIFEHALQRAGNPCKSKVLMVGDNLHSDILGGINFGIDTCWLNPHGASAADGINPRYTVSSLAELQSILNV